MQLPSWTLFLNSTYTNMHTHLWDWTCSYAVWERIQTFRYLSSEPWPFVKENGSLCSRSSSSHIWTYSSTFSLGCLVYWFVIYFLSRRWHQLEVKSEALRTSFLPQMLGQWNTLTSMLRTIQYIMQNPILKRNVFIDIQSTDPALKGKGNLFLPVLFIAALTSHTPSIYMSYRHPKETILYSRQICQINYYVAIKRHLLRYSSLVSPALLNTVMVFPLLLLSYCTLLKLIIIFSL